MKTINAFQHDHWEETPVDQLVIGDYVSLDGVVATVVDWPYEKDGVTHVPATPSDVGPVKVMVGAFSEGKDHIMQAMDLVGSELAEFEDGTALITDFEDGHNLVYSPRLPVEELESFCLAHIDRYRAFHNAHFDRIADGKPVPMTPWWGSHDAR